MTTLVAPRDEQKEIVMRRNRTRIARLGLPGTALWSMALGATGGCAMGEEEGRGEERREALLAGASERDVRPPLDAEPSDAVHLATTSIVVPILLVPSGSAVNSTQLLILREALGSVRLWYQRELPSKDLRWDTLKILPGRQTAAHYLQNDNVWAEVPGEIQAAFGWNPWDNTGNNHIALVIGRDLLGWAGGAALPEGRGVAILGFESLVDLPMCAGNWWCTQEMWHGTAIHELGHALTLPHDTDPTSIMSFHGDYKDKHLIADARTAVEALPVAIPNRPYPRARWTFDDYCTGGAVPDESGNGNTLALSGAVGCMTGLVDGAGYFDGIDDLGEVGHGGLNATTALTIAAWVKADNVTRQQTLVNKWYVPDSYALAIGNGRYLFTVVFPGGTYGIPVEVSAPATAGAWAHVAGVFTGTQLRLYVNGVLASTAAATGMLQPSTRPVAVGNHPSWNAFEGLIDDLQLYDAALERNDIFAY
jgi:hypothetical protein